MDGRQINQLHLQNSERDEDQRFSSEIDEYSESYDTSDETYRSVA